MSEVLYLNQTFTDCVFNQSIELRKVSSKKSKLSNERIGTIKHEIVQNSEFLIKE